MRGFRPTEHVLYEDAGGEVVLLELASGNYYSLDEVGSRIWTLAVAGNTSEAIVADLIREYDVSHDQATRDVARIIEELQRHGLLESVDV